VAYLDFAAIKEEVSIEEAVHRLGLDLKKTKNQFRGECPTCKEGGERALCVTPSKNAFYCFGGKKGGDVIELVAHIKECGAKEAAQFLVGPVPKEKKPTKSPPSEGKGFTKLDYIQSDHEAVEAVGFNPEDAERIGCGYAPRGVLRGHVAVPIRMDDGKLIGYLGVTEALLPPKWQF
jgi:DNA primase